MAAGDLKKNANRPVRVEDVARVAGVSPITVSRALSHPDKVREETRRRILEAVEQTGYVVNRFASSLRSGRSNVISVFVSSLMNPHFAGTMQGILDAMEGSRFHLMFAQTGYSEKLSKDMLDSILPFRPAAVVFTGVVRADDSRRALQNLGIPVMETWGYRPDPIDMLVGFSSHDGGRLMGEHFGQRKFRRIAFSGHTLDRGAERLEGFKSGLKTHGAELDLVHPMEGTRGFLDGAAALEAILEKMPDCDAIFFGTDVLAAGALTRAAELDIDVPGKLALAGFGALDFTAHTRPALTTVEASSYKMGLDAGRMLLKKLNGEAIERPVVLQPLTLEARESTAR